ncbi:MAG: SDR family NAD(P)-dependent oxidoreductase [Nevskia sp.]|nr:SDR family NAD(P)-dependent oxidoreductase [Nevskia sp.]
MTTNNILITGGSSGLGYASAQALQRRTMPATGVGRILVTATTGAAALQAAARLTEETGVSVHGLQLDLASAGSIDACVTAIEELLGQEPLAAVALNAGIQIVDGLKRNEAGHELTMAVNHVGHLRLLFRLWRRIRSGGRVVFIGSGTHNPDERLARMFGFRGSHFRSVADWLEGSGDPRRNAAQQGLDRYANSKLANIMTALELTRRVPAGRMEFYAVDPGLMPGTGLARDHNWFDRAGWMAMRALIPLIPGSSTPEESALVVAGILLGRHTAGSVEDHYLDFKGRPAPRTALADDAQAARAMLDQTLELLGVAPRDLLG